MIRLRAIAVLIVLSAIQCGTTVAEDAKRKYPAKISVVSTETNDKGHLKIRLRLKIDEDVAIYANPVRAPGMDHASARVTILDANKKLLRANVTYPKGAKLHTEVVGDWYLYRKSADIDVLLSDNPPLPLIVRAKIAGYNERVPYCLGFGTVETTLTTQRKKTEPRDATEPGLQGSANGKSTVPAR